MRRVKDQRGSRNDCRRLEECVPVRPRNEWEEHVQLVSAECHQNHAIAARNWLLELLRRVLVTRASNAPFPAGQPGSSRLALPPPTSTRLRGMCSVSPSGAARRAQTGTGGGVDVRTIGSAIIDSTPGHSEPLGTCI
ncbi:hypothetical protein ANO11243_028810 [Dothideomycetidae sp. 11243]|nr:hypothetical protein ANO11243_028810 [fungal sp. No.11243]